MDSSDPARVTNHCVVASRSSAAFASARKNVLGKMKENSTNISPHFPTCPREKARHAFATFILLIVTMLST